MARHPLGRLAATFLLAFAAGCGSEPEGVVATYRSHVGQRIIEAGVDGWGRVEERGRGEASEIGRYTLTTPEGRNLVVTRRKEGWIVADAVDHLMWDQRNWPPPAPPSRRAASWRAGRTRSAPGPGRAIE